MFKVFITDFTKFDNGVSEGLWFEFPAAEDEIEELKSKFDETFIANWKCDALENFEVNAFTSVDELNDLGERLDNLTKRSLAKVDALLEYGEPLEEAIDMIDDILFYPNMTLADVALKIIDTCYNFPEKVIYNFDCEKYVKDLKVDGYEELSCGTIAFIWEIIR